MKDDFFIELKMVNEFNSAYNRAKTTTSVDELKELATYGFIIRNMAINNPHATEEVVLIAYATDKLYNLNRNRENKISIESVSKLAQDQ